MEAKVQWCGGGGCGHTWRQRYSSVWGWRLWAYMEAKVQWCVGYMRVHDILKYNTKGVAPT